MGIVCLTVSEKQNKTVFSIPGPYLLLTFLIPAPLFLSPYRSEEIVDLMGNGRVPDQNVLFLFAHATKNV